MATKDSDPGGNRLLGRRLVLIVLRLLVAAGLVTDAVVHLHLASGYQLAAPAGIGEGNLFRIESAGAIAAALFVLVRGSRLAFFVAAVVALGGVGFVVLYRYVNIPGFGPIPSMYEPIWFFQKSLSAVAEFGAGLVAIIALFIGRRQQA